MITINKTLTTLALSTLLTTTVYAQPFGIGTSEQGSATYGIGAAIATVATQATDEQYVVQPYGGTGKVLPLVNSGRLDFGLANILEVDSGFKGTGPFMGRSNENLRIVGVLYPFEVGLFVRKDSDIYDINDIAGHKITAEYTGSRIIAELSKALLANADLTMDDMVAVPTSGIVSNANDFTAGLAEIGFFAVGAGKMNEVNASVGGIRFLPINVDAKSVERMQAVIPQTFVQYVEPSEHKVGVDEPMYLMAYDYVLYAGAHVSNESIYKLVASMIEKRQALADSFAGLSSLDPKTMGKDVGLPYHPGAIRYYKENGLWHE